MFFWANEVEFNLNTCTSKNRRELEIYYSRLDGEA